MKSLSLKEYKEKITLIEKLNKAYYDNDKPLVSDAEYDNIKKDILEFEKKNPDIAVKDSPIKKVGYKPSEKFSKVKHLVPMLSLDNAFTKDDVGDFLKKIRNYLNLEKDAPIELTAEPKIDGISASLIYKNNKIIRGLSRGDGEYGEDITENLLTIKDIPKVLHGEIIDKEFEIRGEVYIGKKDFEKIKNDFLDALKPLVEKIKVGNPKEDGTEVGTLINEKEATRVVNSIRSAVSQGAKLITGGHQDGAIIKPAIVSEVDPNAAIAQEELFGPAVIVSTATSTKEALDFANSTPYGLGSGVFTKDVNAAIQSAREIDSGIVHINWTPLWRADLMPYGGLKASGIGKEGVRSAIEEMTEVKTIILHGQSWN